MFYNVLRQFSYRYFDNLLQSIIVYTGILSCFGSSVTATKMNLIFFNSSINFFFCFIVAVWRVQPRVFTFFSNIYTVFTYFFHVINSSLDKKYLCPGFFHTWHFRNSSISWKTCLIKHQLKQAHFELTTCAPSFKHWLLTLQIFSGLQIFHTSVNFVFRTVLIPSACSQTVLLPSTE